MKYMKKNRTTKKKYGLMDLATEMSARFGIVDKMVGSISQKLNNLDQKVNNLDQKVSNLDQKVSNLDAKLEEMGEALQLHITDTEKRFDKIGSDIGVIKATMVTKDYLDKRLERFAAVNNLVLREE